MYQNVRVCKKCEGCFGKKDETVIVIYKSNFVMLINCKENDQNLSKCI